MKREVYNTQYVVPAPQGGWNVKKGGAKEATVRFETKQLAINKAKEISKNQDAEMVVHNKNG